jgi:hypothetical protein
MPLKRYLSAIWLAAVATLVAMTPPAEAASSRSNARFAPDITSVVVDMGVLEIVVTGSNLHDGTDPVVSLGGELIPAPHGLDVDGRALTVAIPPRDDGTYLLAITTSKGVASMGVTIGVVGPQGATGNFDTAGARIGMVPGWPDAIRCDFSEALVTTGPTIFRLTHAGSPSFGNLYVYRVPGGGAPPSIHDFYFNSDGTYAGKFNLDDHASNCDGRSIQEIIDDKRGFFFLVVAE